MNATDFEILVVSVVTFFIGFILGKLNRKYEKKVMTNESLCDDDYKEPHIRLLVYNKGKSTERTQRYLEFDTIPQFNNYKDFQECDMSSVKQCPGSLFLYVNGEMKEYRNSDETQKFF